MVDVRNMRCVHDSCTRRPSFNVLGKRTTAYCKEHAQDGMMDVRKGRCAYESCTKYPSFNVDGSKTAVYCNLHAQDGMVDVPTRRFIDIFRGAPPERIAPDDNETSLCTGLNADNLDFAGGMFENDRAGHSTASTIRNLSIPALLSVKSFKVQGWVPVRGVLTCLLYTSPSPRDKRQSRMPSSA